MTKSHHSARPRTVVSPAVLLGLVFAITACGPPAPAPEALSPALLIVGIDGAEWDIVESLIDQGRLPTMAGLLKRGTSARVRASEPLISPPLWTTIATGRPPLEHGITWFMSVDDSGQAIPATGARRRVPAVWDLASHEGLRVAVVSWWATWPAEPLNGVMVSDRLAAHGVLLGDHHRTDSVVYPPGRTAEIVAVVEAASREVPSEFEPVLPRSAMQTTTGHASHVEVLASAIRATESAHRVALHLLEAERFDLICVYYEGIDTVSHRFMAAAPPPMDDVDPDFARAYGSVVERFYVYQDRLLGELITATGENSSILVVSDHGFRSGAKRRPGSGDDDRLRDAPADHLPEALLMLAGEPFAGNTRASNLGLDQIASLALYSLGLGLDERAMSKLPRGIVRPAYLTANPPRTVADFPQRVAPSLPTGDPDIEPERHRLEALGYVQPPVGNQPAVVQLDIKLHEAIYLQLDGQLAEAAELYGELMSRFPDQPRPAEGLAGIRLEQGRLPEARVALEKARLAGGAESVISLEGRVLAAEGRLDEAAELLETVVADYPGLADAQRTLAGVYFRQRRWREARQSILALTQIEPQSTQAWFNLGRVEQALADEAAARQAYQRAASLDPRHLGTQVALGQLLERAGEHLAAVESYRQALEVDPGDLTANLRLGFLFFNLGRPAEAVPHLEQAAEQRPDIADIQRTLETARARSGG